MSKIKGRDFIVFTAVTGQVKALGCSTACTLNIEQELVETLNKSNWRWRRFVNGKRGWSIEVGGYIDNGGIDPMTMLGVSFVVGFATVASHEAMNADDYVADGRRQYYGIGQLASCQLTGELEGYATYSLSFQGSGELTTSAPLLVDDGEGNVSLVLTTSQGESVYVPGLGNSPGGSYLSAYTGQAIDASVAATQTGIPASMLAQQNARYTAFGAVYDSGTGTWKMHKVDGTYLVTGLTADEMEVICAGADLNCGSDFIGALASGKTNRPLKTYRVVRGGALPVNFYELAHGNTALEVFYSPYQNNQFMLCVSNMQNAFLTCSNLRIVKFLDVKNCNNFGTYSAQTQKITSAFGGCEKLEELYMKGIGDFTSPIAPASDTNSYPTLELKDCKALTKTSALYIINNAINQNKICIRFSAQVSWAGDAEVIAACAATETHAQIVLEFM